MKFQKGCLSAYFEEEIGYTAIESFPVSSNAFLSYKLGTQNICINARINDHINLDKRNHSVACKM